MANQVSIALMRDRAMQRLQEAMSGISSELGIDPATLPQFNRDRDYLHATQLEALADWAEAVAGALQPQRAVEGSTNGSHTVPKNKASRR